MHVAPSRYRCILAVALLLGGLVPAHAAQAEVVATAPAPLHQLRIYRVHPGNERAFHERFRDHALRIMDRHGFEVVATWQAQAEGRTEFVYLLQWPDETAMKRAWAGFMADAEWSAIKQRTGAEYGRFVDAIEDRSLQLTDYSPRRRLAD